MGQQNAYALCVLSHFSLLLYNEKKIDDRVSMPQMPCKFQLLFYITKIVNMKYVAEDPDEWWVWVLPVQTSSTNFDSTLSKV